MREIKFRAWNTETQSMLDWEGMYNLKDFIDDSDLFKVMQFTGLKDKNGVEIYEGDIIKSRVYSNKLKVVSWHEYNHYVGFNVSAYTGDRGKVIGNIYESPELLKGAAS